MDMQARGELPLCGKRGLPGLCPPGSLPAGVNAAYGRSPSGGYACA